MEKEEKKVWEVSYYNFLASKLETPLGVSQEDSSLAESDGGVTLIRESWKQELGYHTSRKHFGMQLLFCNYQHELNTRQQKNKLTAAVTTPPEKMEE